MTNPPSGTAIGLVQWQINRIQDILDRRLGERIGVEEMSSVIGYSASYFSRRFKESFGDTPYAYLMKLRLRRTLHLLGSTDFTVAEIARLCGFADQSHLCRAFRRAIGQSPAAWRRATTNRHSLFLAT